MWGVMQESVYNKKVSDVDKLRECVVEECQRLDQSVIDSAIR